MRSSLWSTAALSLAAGLAGALALHAFLVPVGEDATLVGEGDLDAAGVHRRIDATERRIADLEKEVVDLRRAAFAAVAARSPSGTAPKPEAARESRGSPSETPVADAAWYLEQYVASFSENPEGSEFFRLAVDAYALDLVDRMLALVLDGAERSVLRQKLIGILGGERFKGDARVTAPFLRALARDDETAVVDAFLAALASIGDKSTAQGLENLAFSIDGKRERILDIIVRLAGDDANWALQRLFSRAPDEAAKIDVLERISTRDLDAALELYRTILNEEQPVRLVGALRVGGFKNDAFRQFVDVWIARETDEAVRDALGAAKEKQNRVAAWNAMKAVGAPDTVDITRDSPTAWASRDPDGGIEWIELSYAPAKRAGGVRIHEVSAAGGVIEVIAVDEAGGRHSVWKGKDPLKAPGIFECGFAETSYRVQAIRIVIDTRIGRGWNEIDAVELLGPDGNIFASQATSSSNYGGDDDDARTDFFGGVGGSVLGVGLKR